MSKSEKSKPKQIYVVHFDGSIPLGKALEQMSHVAEGALILGELVSLDGNDPNFLRLDYKSTSPNGDYSEYIPWSRVNKVIFKD